MMRHEFDDCGRTRRAGRALTVMTLIGTLMLLAFASACTARRSAGTRLDDAAITAKVKSKIAADPQVNPFEVDVDTTKGVVRLSGMVETERDRATMERIAVNTNGVVEVVNDIRIGDPTVADVVSDTAIESEVKAKLTADPEVNPFRIDVDVVKGVVTLSGEVDDYRTRQEAERLALNTEGVLRVDNRIKLTDETS